MGFLGSRIGIAAMAVVAGFAFGYIQGGKSERLKTAIAVSKLNDRLDEASSAASVLEIKRLNAERERDAAREKLHNEILDDVGSGNISIGSDSVRRINRN